MSKRVCVVGTGPAGLAAMREACAAGASRGWDIIGLEGGDTVGGTFARTYSLLLTSSNTTTAFGSCNPTDAPHTIWTNLQYANYLREFAEQNGLIELIRFRTTLTKMQLTDDAQSYLQLHNNLEAFEGLVWQLTTHNYSTDKDDVLLCHHVIVCTGGNINPALPPCPGTDIFKGQIVHSKSYQTPEICRDKNVLLVGLGESGSDIALSVAQVAKSTTICSRSGPGYVIPRFFGGRVTDLDTSRVYHSLPICLGGSLLIRFKLFLESFMMDPKLDNPAVLAMASKFNAERGLPWQQRFGTKNTSFVEAIVSHGAVYKHCEVARLEENHVVLSSEERIPCDMVLCCTGYTLRFPFAEECIPELTKVRSLYKHMIHPRFGNKLALIGFVRPGVGNIPLMTELQSRYYAMLMTGELQLPSTAEMSHVIAADLQKDLTRYPVDGLRISTLTDFHTYLNELASIIGCRPQLWRLFFTDPAVWYKVMASPICGAQFRLNGPGAMPAEAKRTLSTLSTMPLPVVLWEFALLFGCKLLSMIGFRSLAPTDF